MQLHDPIRMARYLQQYQLDKIVNEQILACAQLHIFHRGDRILHRGEPLHFLYFLLEGKAKTVYVTQNGTNSLQSFLTPLNVLGDIEFWDESSVLNDVSALEDVYCLLFPVAICGDQLRTCVSFLQFIGRELSYKLKHSNHNSSISMNYLVEERLASYIVASCHQSLFMDNQLDTAEMIGCSYRQLQRALQSLCERGDLQKIKKGMYQIRNKKALEERGKDIYVL